jgi:MoxR-like ATPase
MNSTTIERFEPTKYFDALQKAMIADGEFSRRVNNHVRALSGHANVVAFLNNGSSDEDKTKVLIECLVAFRNKDYSKLRDPAKDGVVMQPSRVVEATAEETPTPRPIDDFTEEDREIENEPAMERREEQVPVFPEEDESNPELTQAMRLLNKAFNKPKQLDEAQVQRIVVAHAAARASAISMETKRLIAEALQTFTPNDVAMQTFLKNVNETLAKHGTEVKSEVEALLKNGIVTALESAAAKKISDGLQSGELELAPKVLPVESTYVANAVSKMIARAVRRKDHVIVSGPSGSGKTFPIEQELRAAGIGYIGPVSCGAGMTKKDLLAREWLKAGPNGVVTQWIYGFIVRAMQFGCPLILDEISQLEKEVISHIYYAMEYGKIHLQETGETITAKPGFQVFGTDNALTDTSGLYSGYGLSIALTNRFKFIYSDYMEEDPEKQIFEKHGVSAQVAKGIRTFLERARGLYKSGVITFAPSTRTGKEIAREMADGLNLMEAIRYTIADGLPVEDANKVLGLLPV